MAFFNVEFDFLKLQTFFSKYTFYPKNNILMSENISQKKLTFLEYLDAYIYHRHFRLIMMTNICIEIFQNC